MNFDLQRSIEVLERTPIVLEKMLSGLSESWIKNNEGPDTWSPYDVVGHLIHGEKTDWIPRMDIILSVHSNKRFEPFDRLAQFNESAGKPLSEMLDEFAALRQKNLQILKSKNLSEQDLRKTGIHPAFGEVTLKQLLSTWVAHDMTHVAQVARVMSKQYTNDVGPWIEYLSVLKS